MTEKDEKVIKRIEEELEKINKKENNIYFFITSTHGIFDETLDYIYKMATLLHESNYKVSFIHQDEDFKENDWLMLDETVKDIPLYDISKGEVNVGVSDVLFIPEVFATVMNQTTKLPCKRIAVIQNVNYLTKFMPIASQFGDFGILDFMTFDENESQVIKSMFPYLKEHVVHSYIQEGFYCNKDLRDITVNVVSKSEDDVLNITKQFYWKYPLYKWVTFKDIRGLTQEDYAKCLQESNITIVVDEKSNLMLETIEAFASNNTVIAKIPDIQPSWSKDENGQLNNSAIWVNSIQDIPQILANLIRAHITDSMPKEITDSMKQVLSMFPKEKSKEEINLMMESILNERVNELNNIIEKVKKQ